ncbi:MAG: cell division protein ZapA [Defluviitaleaceae bacterium]|nr:cell division protein ZapA [Defluviitaleaceae bacterium]MCL2275707.1 cell division protein ZapA [Defluviitaleaceae bacterium]
MENKVEVVINGEVIPIKSSNSVEYIQKLAHYAGQRIEELAKRYETIMISERARSYLIALNIADDYLKVEPELKKLQNEHNKLTREHSQIYDENIKLTERVHSLERELAQARAELDEMTITMAEEQNKIVQLQLPFGEARKAIG